MIMSNWLQGLIDKECNKMDTALNQLRKLREAVDNTETASWWELLLVRYLGTEAGGLICWGKVYNYREYKSKLYYIPNENTPTDLHP